MNEMYQVQQNEEESGISINLREIVQVIWSKILWILLVVVVCAAGAFVYTKVTEKPVYRSNATLYFVCDHANPATAIAVATYQAGDFAEIAKAPEALRTVKENLNLEMSHQTIGSKIVVSYNPESRIVNLSVTDQYPNRAQSILDEVCRVAKELSVDRSGAGASVAVYGAAGQKRAKSRQSKTLPQRRAMPSTALLIRRSRKRWSATRPTNKGSMPDSRSAAERLWLSEKP